MSPVEFLSALVAPAPSAPAVPGDAPDAAAFKKAVDAAAGPVAAPTGADAAAPATKKLGFLHSTRLIEANAAGVEAEPAVIPAGAAAATPVVAPAKAEDAGALDAAASDEAAPVVDAATTETGAGAPVVVAPAAPETAPAAEGEVDEADEDEGLATVERTLAAVLDRILVETGASGDETPSAERLEAAQEAIGRVIEHAPPQARPKLEALLARMAAAAETASAEPERADLAGEAAEAPATEVAAANDQADAPASKPTVSPAVLDLIRKAAGETVKPELRLAAATPAARSVPVEAPASPAEPTPEISAKPADGAEPTAASGAPKPESSKPSAAPEPAAAPSVQAEAPVDAVAPADTAAGAPAAHAGTRMVAAEAVRGSPETVAHLSAEILKKLEGRSTRFDMELHPADLGRVDVRLTIEADGRLKAQMAFDNPVAAADLRARADELRRSLEQAGFQISEDALSFADRDGSGRSFEDARQQFADGGRARAKAFRSGGQTAELADAAPVARRAVRLGVDVRI